MGNQTIYAFLVVLLIFIIGIVIYNNYYGGESQIIYVQDKEPETRVIYTPGVSYGSLLYGGWSPYRHRYGRRYPRRHWRRRW